MKCNEKYDRVYDGNKENKYSSIFNIDNFDFMLIYNDIKQSQDKKNTSINALYKKIEKLVKESKYQKNIGSYKYLVEYITQDGTVNSYNSNKYKNIRYNIVQN